MRFWNSYPTQLLVAWANPELYLVHRESRWGYISSKGIGIMAIRDKWYDRVSFIHENLHRIQIEPKRKVLFE